VPAVAHSASSALVHQSIAIINPQRPQTKPNRRAMALAEGVTRLIPGPRILSNGGRFM